MFLKILLLTWTLQLVEVNLSLVLDSMSQKGMYVADYCPKMPFCAEGAHVMCMYYDANRPFGSQCSSPMKNTTMTPELATKLLEVTNAIRGKLAMGTEKGRGGEKLPRAYGMFKLQWDNELATFAQVLAKQCLLRHDMCRASRRFPNPSQAVGKTRFTYPDWHPAGTKDRHYAPGLNNVKITYAITAVMKNWYQHKAAVTPEMIKKYPDWDLQPDRKDGRFYMDMVYSASTHMGCGISAYAEYGYNDNKSKLNYYAILTICNFSGSPKKGKPVYPVEPDEQTSPCGCPPNTVEDENCLCSFVGDAKSQRCVGTDCDQSVILLPIFAVEDAPPSKLISKPRAIRKGYEERSNAIIPPHSSLEYLDYPQNGSNHEHPIVKVLNGIMNGHHIEKLSHKPRASSRRVPEKPVTTLYHKQSPDANPGRIHPRLDHAHSRKTSIFSRSVLFGTSNPNKLSLKDLKKSVVPRKDFSNAKHLVNNYVESTKNYTHIQHRPHLPDDKKFKKASTSTEHRHDAEEHEINDSHDNGTLHSDHDEIHYHHERGQDAKLLTLLDKLEKEIQHTELRGDKKELFDAKIRKIYDSVVGKSSGIPAHQFDHHNDFENEVNSADHYKGHKTELIKEHNHETDVYDDIGNTMADSVGHNHHGDTLRNNIDEDSDRPKSRRMKVKSRKEVPYDKEREVETDYEIQPRENANSNLQKDKLLRAYRNSDNEYKPYRFPESRQSYKSNMQDHSYENLKMNQFSDDEGIRRDKRLKHTREYNNNRNTNSVDNSNKNHYRRHQVMEDIGDDILSPDRRKYYQEKLENLERNLHNTRTHKYRAEETDHRRRAMRIPSSDDEAPRRPSKSHLEHFDLRERSRFIHGY